MSATDGWCVKHDLHQYRLKKGTSDAGKPVRWTRTETYSTQQDTDKSKEKSKTISAMMTDKPKSTTDILVGMVLSGQVQRREDSIFHPYPTIRTTLNGSVTSVTGSQPGKATARHTGSRRPLFVAISSARRNRIRVTTDFVVLGCRFITN